MTAQELENRDDVKRVAFMASKEQARRDIMAEIAEARRLEERRFERSRHHGAE